MPNWCSTAYVIEGDAQEIKSLYELMKDLQDRKTPAVKNGFGTSWLGCLVDALGKDWDKVSCRGDWANLEMVGETLRFTTETAWGAMQRDIRPRVREIPIAPLLLPDRRAGNGLLRDQRQRRQVFYRQIHSRFMYCQRQILLRIFCRQGEPVCVAWRGRRKNRPLGTGCQGSV